MNATPIPPQINGIMTCLHRPLAFRYRETSCDLKDRWFAGLTCVLCEVLVGGERLESFQSTCACFWFIYLFFMVYVIGILILWTDLRIVHFFSFFWLRGISNICCLAFMLCVDYYYYIDCRLLWTYCLWYDLVHIIYVNLYNCIFIP